MRMAIAAAAAFLLVAACRPTEPPVLIEPSHVRPLLHWSNDLEGKRVAVDGYLHLDNGPDGTAIAIMPHLTSRPRGKGEALISFKARQGDGPNELDLEVIRSTLGPGGVGEIQLIDMTKGRFQDAAGTVHPAQAKIRVIGRLAYDSREGVEDLRSNTGRRYNPRLEDVTLEASPSR